MPQDKSYAFVEFRSVEEASNCMALDGVRFKDSYLKVSVLRVLRMLPGSHCQGLTACLAGEG